MDFSSFSQDGPGITVYFIERSENEATTCQMAAYQACKDQDINPQWITEDGVLKLSPTKQDIFICDPFEGKAFDFLTQNAEMFKCVRVLGPRCILSCLVRYKESVPEVASPIHNVAMRRMIITLTGFEGEAKRELITLIGKMAGIYSNQYNEAVTHIVAKTVGSKKYQIAASRESPIMTEEWVRSVWNAANLDNDGAVDASDEEFLTYTCPVFKGLTICISQMPKKEKDSLCKLIQDNGGVYSSVLEMNITSVLITPVAEGDKFKHAVRWRIDCLTPDWIIESVGQNYALDMSNYKVKARQSSTPTKDISTVRDLGDISGCSTILMNESSADLTTQVNETVNTTITSTYQSEVNPKEKKSTDAVDELDLQAAMKAGQFLDGCKIFLAGFSNNHIEKLRRCLNAGGATRFNQLSDNVTHIIMGKPVEQHLNTIEGWTTKPHVVSAEWLVQCVTLKKTADEADFLYFNLEPKADISVNMRPPPSIPVMQTQEETFVDADLMNQYLSENQRDTSLDVSSLPSSQAPGASGIFAGKKFVLLDCDKFEMCEIAIKNEGGAVVDAKTTKGIIDFCIMSMDRDVYPLAHTYANYSYISECLEREELLTMDYYYLPIGIIDCGNILKDCVISTTNYFGPERQFLMELAEKLGAIFQDVFCRKSMPSKNTIKTTHLLCSKPTGKKYEAAKNWGVPAVCAGWLVECLIYKKKLPAEDFSVDDDSQSNSKNYFSGLSNLIREIVGNPSLQNRSKADKPLVTPLNNRVQSLMKDGVFQSPQVTVTEADIEHLKKLYPTPGRTPANNNSLSNMPTPETPYGCTWYANPDPTTRKVFKRLLDSLPDEPEPKKVKTNPKTPMEVYLRKFADGVEEYLKNSPIPKLDLESEPDKQNSNQIQKHKENISNNNQRVENRPLKDVVVFVSKKLSKIQRDIFDTVIELGGDTRWTYDESVTHFIFQGRENDLTKEFRVARDQNKFIVAPEWVWICRDENTRFDESLFPHTHNPKLTLSITSTSSNPPPRSKRLRQKKNCANDIPESSNSDDSANCSNNQPNEEITKQLEELQALASVTGDRELSRRCSASKSFSDKSVPTPPRIHHQQQPQTVEIASTQSTAITWVDPQEKEAREKLRNELLTASRDTQDIIAENNILAQACIEETLDPIQEVTNETSKIANESIKNIRDTTENQSFIFILTGFVDEEKKEVCREMVVELGGEVRECEFFDLNATHVITMKTGRSEKLLTGIASGKWLLYSSFIEASYEAGAFVKEEDHQWGNPHAENLPMLSEGSVEQQLACAAYKWRAKLSTDSSMKGAFQGMKFLICASENKQQAYSRLILAGQGTIDNETRPPYTDPPEDITVCMVDPNRVSKVDLAVFASRNIACVKPLFIFSYLLDPQLNYEDCCLEDYLTVKNNMAPCVTERSYFLRKT